MGASHTTCVFWAAQEGRTTDLVFHLDSVDKKKRALALTYTDKKWTPLHAAVMRGHQQCVRILCESGEVLYRVYVKTPRLVCATALLSRKGFPHTHTHTLCHNYV